MVIYVEKKKVQDIGIFYFWYTNKYLLFKEKSEKGEESSYPDKYKQEGKQSEYYNLYIQRVPKIPFNDL